MKELPSITHLAKKRHTQSGLTPIPMIKKNERDRIERDNLKLVSKIVNIKPELDVNDYESHYKNHVYQGEKLAKIKRRHIALLPPIEPREVKR